jgi:hypothetical protein
MHCEYAVLVAELLLANYSSSNTGIMAGAWSPLLPAPDLGEVMQPSKGHLRAS